MPIIECALALAAGMTVGLVAAFSFSGSSRSRPPAAVIVLVTLAVAVATTPVFASDWSASIVQRAANPTPPARSRPAVQPASVERARPPAAGLTPQTLFLVRSTLMALNDANRTANYSVLRALASPAFQARYSDLELQRVFAALRAANLDLAAAALVAPRLTSDPLVKAGQHMRLVGTVEAEPSAVAFDLAFAASAGHWRLDAVTISSAPARR